MKKIILVMTLLVVLTGCGNIEGEKSNLNVNATSSELTYEIQKITDEYSYKGLTIQMNVYDGSEDVLWTKIWEGIYISEEKIYSDPIFYLDRVSIIVDSELYTLDKEEGKEIWSITGIECPNIDPVIDEDGNLYIVSSNSMCITAISSEGEVVWQKRDEEYADAYDLVIDGTEVVVLGESTDIRHDMIGKRAN